MWLIFSLTTFAHEGEDHSKKAETKTVSAKTQTAERNLQTDSGSFRIVLEHFPADARAGEENVFNLSVWEKIEGGFGNQNAPLDGAQISAQVLDTNGKSWAENFPLEHLGEEKYEVHYAFSSAGNYKIFFSIKTADNRSFKIDFPVSIANAPINWAFWIFAVILLLLTTTASVLTFKRFRRSEKKSAKRLLRFFPILLAFFIGFVLLTSVFAFFVPPRQTRDLAAMQTEAVETTNQDANKPQVITTENGVEIRIPEQTQKLFAFKTEEAAFREIIAGLKVFGTVKTKPDAKAIVSPPVAGRLILNNGITLGAAVGKGEQVGTVQQTLDVSSQTEIESQRLEVDKQRLELETQRLSLKNSLAELRAKEAEQNSLIIQARTRLAQAQKELRRSENLLEVGAVPRKRVEEAQTAVKLIEQEITSAEKQANYFSQQAKTIQTTQTKFNQPIIRNAPRRSFPIFSPVTGIISEFNAVSGSQVEPTTEIFSLTNLSVVLLEAQVFEKDLPQVRDAKKASYTSPSLPSEVYRIGEGGDGQLLMIGQTVNSETRAVPVIYEVINPLGKLRDGMSVEITIDTNADGKILSVPKTAVIEEQGQFFVFVQKDAETFEKRAVVLGSEGQEFYGVKQGLKEGEKVVTEGIYQLRSIASGG